MKKFLRKNPWVKTVGIILAVVLALGLIVGLTSNTKKPGEEGDAFRVAYSVGKLDSNGEYKEAKNSIYSSDMFECEGLNVTVDFEHDVKYQLFFYDEDGKFISCLSATDNKTDETEIPATAKYARIMITPLDDDRIGIFEVSKYANQVNLYIVDVEEEETEN